MLNITNELKAKLLSARNAEEVTELVKAEGQEITAEEALHLWEEITKGKQQDGKELSIDELEAVSGGSDRDWVLDDCAATVEPYSWCKSDDACVVWDVTYDNYPLDERCPTCGTLLYSKQDPYEAYYKVIAVRHICKKCGYNIIDHYV